MEVDLISCKHHDYRNLNGPVDHCGNSLCISIIKTTRTSGGNVQYHAADDIIEL